MLRHDPKKRIWCAAARRAICLLLCLCLVMPVLLPPTRADAAEGVQQNNMYLLRVDTGINPGTHVQYIAVRYVDTSGMYRTEFLFPNSGSMQDGFALASAAHSVDARLELVNRATHYSPLDTDDLPCLASNSHNEFLFEPFYTLDKVLAVDVYQSYDDTNGTPKGWTCTGMELFKVDTLYGLAMTGYYSSNYYVEFDGKFLWSYPEEPGMAHDFQFSHSDQLYSLGAENRSHYTNMINHRGEKYSTGQEQEFIFEINFADVYEAGIEALATCVADGKPKLEDLAVMEFLDLKLSYLDTSGLTRTVHLPVITSCIGWAVENGMLNYSSQLAGIAQQGDNLVFAGKLPGFASLKEYQLSYNIDADKATGITRSGSIQVNGVTYEDPKKPFSDRDVFFDLHTDRIFLTSLKIYCVPGKGADSVAFTGGTDGNGALCFGITANPTYVYAASSAYGDAVSVGSPKKVTMEKYEEGYVTEPTFDLKNRYIVVINTDDVSFADTASEVQAVFYYRSTSGTNSSTNPFYLSDAVREYYGYWPGANGEYAYSYATARSTQMAFFLDIEELAQFNGVDFFMDTDGTDDWQFKSIAIYKPAQIGKRLVRWQDHQGAKNSTDRVYYREFDKSSCMSFFGVRDGEARDEEKTIYINGNSEENAKKHIDFNGTDVEPEAEDHDWTDSRYSMTYKEAMEDFGFTKIRATYEVQVKVAGNEYATDENGDCGSNNLFFFQLVFQNGSSGFVLANQQLTADGFRAGITETFTISTNQDYGELDSIRILPYDLDEDENQDVFDKLKIDYVSVVKKSNSSLTRTWKAENIGWIEIDYSDQAAANTLKGKQGRTYDQIARDFPITYKGFTQNLMFVISTGPYYASIDEEGNYIEGADADPQLEGSVTATIYYNDGSPGVKEQPVDVVRAIYDYDEKVPVYSDQTGEALIDRTCMMRANHQDRFFVTIENARKITGIRLEVRGTVCTTWNVTNVSVYQINAEGALKINSNGEYQQHYNDELELITTSALDSYKIFVTSDGAEQKQIIDFADNTIDINTSEGEWTTVITREPDNKNDIVNLYVHTYDDGKIAPISAYDLKATLSYYDRYRGEKNGIELTVPKLKKNGDEIFYATELYASGLSNVLSLKLELNSADAVDTRIDYAVIQHMRSGVVVGTYFVDFEKEYIPIAGLAKSPSAGTGYINNQTQKVQLFFAQDTVAAELSEEKTDIAVAIRYTTVNDATNAEYVSPYIFITDPHQPDSELIKYPTVRPGMIAELNFHENFVKKITGIQVVSVGKLSASIASATAAQYNNVAGEQVMTDWTNFADNYTLSHSPSIFTPTETNVVPVEINMLTAMSTDTFGTSTTAPIRMVLSYTNMNNTITRSLTIDDINKYLVSGSFNANETATIRFFMKDLGQIRSITFEPHSDTAYNTSMWGLDTVTVKLTRDGKPEVIERKLTGSDGLISEGQPKTISLMNIKLSTLTTYYNSKVQQQNGINSDKDGHTSILLYSGDTATIDVTLDGTLPGYDFSVTGELSHDGATTRVDCYQRNGNKIVVTPPRNFSGSDEIYVITITSDENPNVRATVEIHVESEPEQILTSVNDEDEDEDEDDEDEDDDE